MIQAEGLTKYYGTFPAIQNVCFSVEKGEITGFLGPNGAGKTTTMRILTGFSPPSQGTAKIAGFDVSKDPIEVKKRVGYVPESVPLYQEMTVSGFLRYVGEVKGLLRKELRVEADRVTERCGLVDMRGRLIKNLSKGYRQRVGLAQALVGNPPVLILDEPTVGLDPKQIVEIRQMIRDLAREHTVLLSTHILAEVSMICQRVIIINRGRIIAQDDMKNLAACGETQTIELEVAGNVDRVLALLREIPGVQSATPGTAGGTAYSVVAIRGDEVRSAISAGLIAQGFALHAMRERTRTLEDVFVEAIAVDQQADAVEAVGA